MTRVPILYSEEVMTEGQAGVCSFAYLKLLTTSYIFCPEFLTSQLISFLDG